MHAACALHDCTTDSCMRTRERLPVQLESVFVRLSCTCISYFFVFLFLLSFYKGVPLSPVKLSSFFNILLYIMLYSEKFLFDKNLNEIMQKYFMESWIVNLCVKVV